MKQILILMLVGVSVSFGASDVSDLKAVRVPDAKGNLHNAGYIQDVVKNYPSLKTEILAAAKTAIEAEITAGKNSMELGMIKEKISLLESAGGVVDSAKKTLVTNSVTIEDQKKTDREATKEGAK
jgi:hypothetical protein